METDGGAVMEKIRRENPKPLYVQLEELIRNKIEEGEEAKFKEIINIFIHIIKN